MKHLFKAVKSFELGQRTSGSDREAEADLRWILPQKLAVGPMPDAMTYPRLQAAGIKAILTLCSEQEGTHPAHVLQDFYFNRLVLPDSHYAEPLQVQQVREAIALVQFLLENEMPVYVHCLAGVERSPTICVAYLCVYHQMQLWEALNWLRQVNPRTGITPEQIRVLQEICPIPLKEQGNFQLGS